MKHLITSLLAIFIFSFAAAQNYTYRADATEECQMDKSGNIASRKELPACYVSFQNIPPMSGQAQTLKFDFEETPNFRGISDLPSIWFQKGQTEYDYKTGFDDTAKMNFRFLNLYSSEFPYEFIELMMVDADLPCLVSIFNIYSGQVYRAFLNKRDGTQLFNTVARLIRNLNIPKRYPETLDIDIY